MVRTYAFPAVMGLLCIATVIGTAALIGRDVRSQIHESLRSAQAAGALPAKWRDHDVERIPVSALGVELPQNLRSRIQLVDFIVAFWFIWAPLIMIVCIGTAAFFRKHCPPVVDRAAGDP